MRVIGTVAAVSLVGLSFLPEAKDSPLSYLVLGPIVAVLTTALIFFVGTWSTIPSRIFAPLLALGTISYAAYLWNWPVTRWLGQYVDGPIQSLGSIALTIVAATISWWAVERPVNMWKKRLDERARTKTEAKEAV